MSDLSLHREVRPNYPGSPDYFDLDDLDISPDRTSGRPGAVMIRLMVQDPENPSIDPEWPRDTLALSVRIDNDDILDIASALVQALIDSRNAQDGVTR